MTTTALRIELVIIGFQSTIWLFVFLELDLQETIEFLVSLKDISALLAVVFIGWCYSFGAAIDGIAGAFEDPVSLFKPSSSPNSNSAIMRLRFPEAYQVLDTKDYELRLLRSTALNLIILCIAFAYTSKAPILSLIAGVVGSMIGMAWFRRFQRSRRRRDSLYAEAKRMVNVGTVKTLDTSKDL